MKDPVLWEPFVQAFPSIIEARPEYARIADSVRHNVETATNVLMYSAPGFPLNLLWDFVATKIWGIDHFSRQECTFGKTVVYWETPYFFEIDFRHPLNTKAMDDVQDFLKMVISTSCLHTDRHIIVCRNMDAAHDTCAFRVLLERFNKNATFVCMTHSLSSIEAPLRSRFHVIRVPLFECSDIANIVATLSSGAAADTFSTRNIYKALYLASEGAALAAVVFNFPPIKDLPSKPTIMQLREIAFKTCNNNIPFASVVEDLLRMIPEKNACAFVQRAAALQHKIVQTNAGRLPLYYELLFHVAFYGEK